MLPDLSAAHIFLLVVLALVVVGPKDLPGLLRKIGQFMAKLRGMANEFRASFDEMARQSELDELRREIETMRAAAAKPADQFRAAASELHGQLMQPIDLPVESAATDAPRATASEPQILPPQPSSIQTGAKPPPKAKPRPKPKAAKPKTAGAKAAPAKPRPKAKAASRKSPSKKARAKSGPTEPGA
jgi:sec-independent protein translocase protein TatB